jgi:hypothetical protein
LNCPYCGKELIYNTYNLFCQDKNNHMFLFSEKSYHELSVFYLNYEFIAAAIIGAQSYFYIYYNNTRILKQEIPYFSYDSSSETISKLMDKFKKISCFV